MVMQVRERRDSGSYPKHGAGLDPFASTQEKVDYLVCPACHADVQEAGVLKVETGLTQVHSFYYHPDAKLFMFDDWTERGPYAETQWHCRACRGALPREIAAYIDQHAAW
jgi:hypothetical protein